MIRSDFKMSNDSDLGYELAYRAGRCLFERSLAKPEEKDALRAKIVDLWTGEGQNQSKFLAASEKGEGEHEFEFTFEQEVSSGQIKAVLPDDLFSAVDNHDASILVLRHYTPTKYRISFNVNRMRDRVFNKLVEEHVREERKRKREEAEAADVKEEDDKEKTVKREKKDEAEAVKEE